jgi:probable HAF family extracellular repeat protein
MNIQVVRVSRVAVAVVFVSVLGRTAPVAAQSIRYDVTNLGTIESSDVCPCFFGQAINDANQVTGAFYATNGALHGFIWEGGTMTDIGTLGGPLAAPLGMNDLGNVVGYSDTSAEPQHAFKFADGQMNDLGTLGGVHSVGRDINDAGVVVGNAQRPEPEHYSHAFLLDSGRMIDLGTLGGAFSDAFAINAAGDIVGWAWNANWDARATHWPAETLVPVDLGSLAGPEGHSHALDINDLGQIVGSSHTGEFDGVTITHAMLWENGEATDLGVLPEAGEGQSIYLGPALVATTATAINNAGTIVGNSFPPAETPELRFGPFVHTNDHMTNLNDLLLAADSTWLITEAEGINNAGVIVGSARTLADHHSRAVILVPVEVALGDLNGDFVVGTGDLLQLLAAWGPCDGCLEDLDLDGTVGTSDLLILLGNWG